MEKQIHNSNADLDADSRAYSDYGNTINPNYPGFLNRLGIDCIAEHAEGVYITDSKGRSFLDCTAGYGLFNLGHNHPAIIQALTEQVHSMQPVTKPLITSIQAEFGKKMTAAAPGNLDCIFLNNSGSESIDSALKLARLATGRKKIIATHGSFHGYTCGALSVTGIKKFRHAFEPLLPEIEFIDYDDLEAATNSIKDDVAAVILEPLQHEAGINVPDNGYFTEIRKLCDKHGALLILDEVKTGFGKLGHLFACERIGVTPDILVLGKSLGGGMIPSGAIVASTKLWRRFGFSFPMSASSFAGNTLACSVGLATLKVLKETDILAECLQKEDILRSELNRLMKTFPDVICSVNGQGLLFGLGMASATITFEVAKNLVEQGIIALPAFGNSSVLMIEPPLVITVSELKRVSSAIESAIIAGKQLED